MNHKVRDIFEQIHAEVMLKEKTADFLHTQMQTQGKIKKGRGVMPALAFVPFILFLFLGILSYNMYFTASAYIDIDVNPSIELTLNRFSQVIAATPYNDDGANILNEVNIHHINYNKALEMLLDTMIQNDCLLQDNLVSVTVYAQDGKKETELLTGIKSSVSASLQAHHTDTQTDIFSVTEEVKKHAHENHISPAKYIAISELQMVDPAINFTKCKEHTIRQLKQLREQHDGGHHIANPANELNDNYETENSSNGHNSGHSKGDRHH